MPRINNITDVSNPFDPADEGIYTLTIVEAEDTKSKSDVEMLKVKLRIDAADDKANAKHIGKTIYDYRVWGGPEPSNFALFGIKQYATAAGVDPTDFDASDLLNVELKALIRVQEGTEEYPDPRNQIGKLLVDVD